MSSPVRCPGGPFRDVEVQEGGQGCIPGAPGARPRGAKKCFSKKATGRDEEEGMRHCPLRPDPGSGGPSRPQHSPGIGSNRQVPGHLASNACESWGGPRDPTARRGGAPGQRHAPAPGGWPRGNSGRRRAPGCPWPPPLGFPTLLANPSPLEAAYVPVWLDPVSSPSPGSLKLSALRGRARSRGSGPGGPKRPRLSSHPLRKPAGASAPHPRSRTTPGPPPASAPSPTAPASPARLPPRAPCALRRAQSAAGAAAAASPAGWGPGGRGRAREAAGGSEGGRAGGWASA